MQRTLADEATVSCDLKQIYLALHDYCDAKKKWPATLKELKVDESFLKDRISRKPYLYFSDARHGTRDVLVAQPEWFRVGLWPFGEIRRHVLTATRADTNVALYGQKAIALPRTLNPEPWALNPEPRTLGPEP